MKRTLLTTLLVGSLAFISCNSVIAGAPETVNESIKTSLRTEISRQIDFPPFVTTNSESNNVNALVRITETGKVEVLQISTANTELRNYVIAELNKIKMDYTQTGPFMLVIKFRAM